MKINEINQRHNSLGQVNRYILPITYLSLIFSHVLKNVNVIQGKYCLLVTNLVARNTTVYSQTHVTDTDMWQDVVTFKLKCKKFIYLAWVRRMANMLYGKITNPSLRCECVYEVNPYQPLAD